MTAVLFTCAGQRVDIVTAFKRAGAFTVAADADPLAPSLYHADAHALVPRFEDPSYLGALAEIVREHDVRLVVPLTDIDQRVVSHGRDKLGAQVLLSDVDVVDAMADKYTAHLWFLEREIPSPPTWIEAELPDELPFPLVVKAREGFGSRHVFRVGDRAELDFFLASTPEELIVQRCCAGEEFSIDVFCDFDGRCLNAIPRTMIQSKGGESIKGATLKDQELIEFARFVAEALPIKGPANIQCFRSPGAKPEVTDVNPRFGGGFPLPLAAGGRYPELALALARGERPEPRIGEFRDGVVMTRFLSNLCLTEGADGALEPYAEDLPDAVAAEPGLS